MAGGLHDPDNLQENHEINVTPFIDVMLVLLIIFMVAAPLATVDIKVDLPVSNAPSAPRPDQPVWLTVGPDLALSIGDNQIPSDGLAQALNTATNGDREARVFLRADQAVSYGDLMGVMNDMRDAGWTKIALVGLETGAAAPATDAAAAPADAAASTTTAQAEPQP